MNTRTLRTCLGLLLAASWAAGTWVSLDAQAGSPKAPAATSAQKKPAPPAAQQKGTPPPAPKTAATQKAARPAGAPTGPAPTSVPPQAPVPAAVPAAAERPPSPEAFTYRPEGRRDPFISLINRATTEKGPPQKRPEGLRGLSFDEISLRGVYMGQTGPIALVQGPDTKTYQVHVGDRLYDAVVKAITPASLVVLQEVNDPLSLQKQRERRKTLRVAEEVK